MCFRFNFALLNRLKNCLLHTEHLEETCAWNAEQEMLAWKVAGVATWNRNNQAQWWPMTKVHSGWHYINIRGSTRFSQVKQFSISQKLWNKQKQNITTLYKTNSRITWLKLGFSFPTCFGKPWGEGIVSFRDKRCVSEGKKKKKKKKGGKKLLPHCFSHESRVQVHEFGIFRATANGKNCF